MTTGRERSWNELEGGYQPEDDGQQTLTPPKGGSGLIPIDAPAPLQGKIVLPDDTPNLWQRIAAIMRDLEPVTKDARADARIGGFPYASPDAVFEAVRPLLGEHGVGVLQNIDDHEVRVLKGRDQEYTEIVLRMSVTLVNCDEPRDRESVLVIADGKSFSSAYSHALKRALQCWFVMSSAEDDEGTPRGRGGPPADSGRKQQSSRRQARDQKEPAPPGREARANLTPLRNLIEDLGMTEGQATVRAMKLFDGRDIYGLTSAELSRLCATLKAEAGDS